MISPPRRSASVRDTCVLPTAVGPVMTKSFGLLLADLLLARAAEATVLRELALQHTGCKQGALEAIGTVHRDSRSMYQSGQ